MSIASFCLMMCAFVNLTFYTLLVFFCLNNPAQDCNGNCDNALDTCCDIAGDADYGNCDFDLDLRDKCFEEESNCKVKCVPYQTCYTICKDTFDHCIDWNYDDDVDPGGKCVDAFDDCESKCPPYDGVSTKVTTDFDIDIEGAFVEEA